MRSIIDESLITKYQHPHVKLVVNGTTITGDDLLAGSFNYKGGASSGGSLEPGGCIIGSISFAVYNYDGKYSSVITDGATVEAYIGYGKTCKTATFAKVATGYISDWTIKRGSISVTAYDKLRAADKNYWTSWSFPMTVNEIIRSACSDAGITVANLPSSGGSISVDLRPVNEDGTYGDVDISMTCRQALSEALKLSGNFGYCDADGNFKCDWFNWGSPAKTINDTFSASFQSAKSYTGVQVGTRAVKGSSGYLFALSSNSFLTDDNASAVESRLYNALVGYSFDTGGAGILQDPNLEPGDVVTLKTPMGTKTIPITAITLKGSMIESIACEATSYDEADDERTDASNDALAEQLDSGVDVDLSEIEKQLTDIGDTANTANDTANEAKSTADGLLSAIEELQKALNGYKLAVMTEAAYDALTSIDADTIYFLYEK